MKYKFVKPKLMSCNIEYGWMFILDSVDVLDSFTNIVQKTIIEEGLKILIKKQSRLGHSTHDWEQIVELNALAKNVSILESSCYLENMVYQSRLHVISTVGCMYINENGSGFPHSKDITILETITKDNLVFPKYCKKDIHIKKWEGGKHYYARIGNNTVVDTSGNQKWNTRTMAQFVAEQFLITMVETDEK